MRQCRLPRRARTRHLLFCDCTCRLFPTKVARPMEPDASRTVHSDTGAIERQLANLTTGPPSLEKETLPPKTTLKKKKKKIKGPYISLTAFAGDYSTLYLSSTVQLAINRRKRRRRKKLLSRTFRRTQLIFTKKNPLIQMSQQRFAFVYTASTIFVCSNL